MATKQKELTEKQVAMLERLKKHRYKTAYMPATAAERSTCEALQRRNLCESVLSCASVKFAGGSRSSEFKLAYYTQVSEPTE